MILIKALFIGFVLTFQVFGQEQIKEMTQMELFELKMSECRDHFDFLPIFIQALTGGDLNMLNAAVGEKWGPYGESEYTNITNNVSSFLQTGKIELSEEQKKDPQTVTCANFTEGMILAVKWAMYTEPRTR